MSSRYYEGKRLSVGQAIGNLTSKESVLFVDKEEKVLIMPSITGGTLEYEYVVLDSEGFLEGAVKEIHVPLAMLLGQEDGGFYEVIKDTPFKYMARNVDKWCVRFKLEGECMYARLNSSSLEIEIISSSITEQSIGHRFPIKVGSMSYEKYEKVTELTKMIINTEGELL